METEALGTGGRFVPQDGTMTADPLPNSETFCSLGLKPVRASGGVGARDDGFGSRY